eukprot:4619868-Prymnesium_polylepis.1
MDQHRARVSSEAHRTVRTEAQEPQRAPTQRVDRHAPTSRESTQHAPTHRLSLKAHATPPLPNEEPRGFHGAQRRDG